MPFSYIHPETGGICCSTRQVCCPRCEARLAEEARALRSAEDFSPPDPYAATIAKLRAAMATPESRFEEQYKAERLREFDAEHAAIDATPMPRLTAAQQATLEAVPAPDPYRAGLDEMRSLSSK